MVRNRARRALALVCCWRSAAHSRRRRGAIASPQTGVAASWWSPRRSAPSAAARSGLGQRDVRPEARGDASHQLAGLGRVTCRAFGRERWARRAKPSCQLDGIGPIGAASEVGVYVNDTPVGSSSSFQDANGSTLDLMPYDLDRVEVLRGPQGTLYGASTMGGLIKYVLAHPIPATSRPDRRRRCSASRIRATPAAASAARSTCRSSTTAWPCASPATTRTRPASSTTPPPARRTTTRCTSTAAASPCSGSPNNDLSVEASAIYQDNHAGQSDLSWRSTPHAAADRRPADRTSTRAPSPTPRQLAALRRYAQLEPALGPADLGVELPDVRQHTLEDLTDYIGRYLARSDFRRRRPRHRPVGPTREFRAQQVHAGGAAGFAERPEARVAGGRLLHARDGVPTTRRSTPMTPSGALLPEFNPLELSPCRAPTRNTPSSATLTYHFTDWFDLTAGVRYAHNDQTLRREGGRSPLNPADPTSAALTVPGSQRGRRDLPGRAELHFDKNTMALRCGSPAATSPAARTSVVPGFPVPSQFNSSTLDRLPAWREVDVAGRPGDAGPLGLPHRLEKIQVSVLLGDRSAIENAGSARSDGFDFSGSYSPIAGLTLGGTLAYADAVLTSDVPSITAVKGARLPYVPLWSGSLDRRLFAGRSRATGSASLAAAIATPARAISAVEGSTSNGDAAGHGSGRDERRRPAPRRPHRRSQADAVRQEPVRRPRLSRRRHSTSSTRSASRSTSRRRCCSRARSA